MILRFCVVIPTCDQGRTISEVVKDAVLNTRFPILVVDDGSETHAHDSLYSWDVRHALETGRVKVLRLEGRKGKGAALKAAIAELVRSGFTHMLTLGACGTFKAAESDKLVSLSRAHPWDMVIGDRKLQRENRAEMSAFRRKISNLIVMYQTGSHIKDAQSGFRIYPLLPLQGMTFWTSGEDFENEALIRLLWQGIHAHEVEVETNARIEEEPRSFYGNLVHSVRISILNTCLVFVSLFKTHRSINEIAWALGLGVFIGCTPAYGFHTVMIAIVAIVFRLNLVVMWLGSHVSTPILAPALIAAEIWVGKNWLNISQEGGGVGSKFYQWLGGSVVVGLGLGFGSVLAVYASSWVMKRRKYYTNWSAKRRGGKVARMLLRMTLKRCGQRGAYALLTFIYPYFYLFSPRARRGLTEYWRLREPKLSWWRRQGKILKHIRTFGELIVDRGLRSLNPGYKFEITSHGFEELKKSIDQKHGAILLSAHMGAWDLSADLAFKGASTVRLLSLRRDGYRFYGSQESMDPTKNRLELRGPLASAQAVIREALARGEALTVMGDSPLGDHYQLIPFLGRLAPFDMTVFRLAADCEVPLYFSFGFREAHGKFHFFASPPKRYKFDPALPREIQCYRWATEFVEHMEKYARRYPDEWFNLYPFWSAPPTVFSGDLAAKDAGRLIEDFGESAKHMPDPSF